MDKLTGTSIKLTRGNVKPTAPKPMSGSGFANGVEQASDFDGWLTQQLQLSEPYVDNDGFCEQVMAQLPPSTKRSDKRATRSQYVAVVAASAIVCWQFPLDQVWHLAAQQSISLYSLIGLGMLGSLVAMAGGIVAARR